MIYYFVNGEMCAGETAPEGSTPAPQPADAFFMWDGAQWVDMPEARAEWIKGGRTI